MKEERKALIDYRLEQADESLDSVLILFEHKKYRPSVSRSYYAMFYAVQALLTRKKLVASKHSGAIATSPMIGFGVGCSIWQSRP